MNYKYSAKTEVVIDLETLPIPPTPEDIEEFVKSEYSGPPKNYKDVDKILAHELSARESLAAKFIEERKFMIDGARVISAALGTIVKGQVSQVKSLFSEDEAEIGTFVQTYLEDCGEYRLIGFNHKTFDLPHLVRILSKNKLGALPRKPGKWDVVDIYRDGPFRDKKGSGAKSLARAFGITPRVPGVSGADVEAMYFAGQFDAIREYNESDIYLEGELYVALNNVFSF